MTFHIACPRSITETFKTAALAVYPREKYAVLFGRRKGNRVTVVDAWYPEDQKKYATNGYTADIIRKRDWRARAFDIAESEGLELVGEIHSHPYEVADKRQHIKDRAPAEEDFVQLWRAGVEPGWIVGICTISRSPRHTWTGLRLWPSLPRTTVQFL